MPQIANTHGLPFTADSEAAVAAFDRTVMNYLSFNRETGNALKTLLAIDPDMPMALCLRGYFMMLMGVGALVGRARKDVAWLAENRDRLNARERMHAEALTAWSDYSLTRATAIWREIATLHPRDILAVKMAHFGLFYLGNSEGIREAAADALTAWQQDDDAQPYLLSMYAFGMEESGYPFEAEAIGREALARQPADPWGIHVVAHALEATGRMADGIAFIDEMACEWETINNFRYHVAWHKALFTFEAGAVDDTLADYDRLVFSDRALEYLDVSNDASLLLRLELAGADIGARWADVAAKVTGRTEERMLAFADLHFLLALASSPDGEHHELARRMAASMADYARSDGGDAAAYRVAAPVADGIIAFRDERYRDAAQSLGSVIANLPLVGGSHAQRDLFHGLLAEARVRAGDATALCLADRPASARAHPYNRRDAQSRRVLSAVRT